MKRNTRKTKSLLTGNLEFGWDSFWNYETNVIWKENHPPLRSDEVDSLEVGSDEVDSLGRLHSLRKGLIQPNKIGDYLRLSKNK